MGKHRAIWIFGPKTHRHPTAQPAGDCHRSAHHILLANPIGGPAFGSGVAAGARIDHHKDPDLQKTAIAVAHKFCAQTQLQLGGFDFIFDRNELKQGMIKPLLLEINYFFGRTGLGGSESILPPVHSGGRWLVGRKGTAVQAP